MNYGCKSFIKEASDTRVTELFSSPQTVGQNRLERLFLEIFFDTLLIFEIKGGAYPREAP